MACEVPADGTPHFGCCPEVRTCDVTVAEAYTAVGAFVVYHNLDGADPLQCQPRRYRSFAITQFDITQQYAQEIFTYEYPSGRLLTTRDPNYIQHTSSRIVLLSHTLFGNGDEQFTVQEAQLDGTPGTLTWRYEFFGRVEPLSVLLDQSLGLLGAVPNWASITAGGPNFRIQFNQNSGAIEIVQLADVIFGIPVSIIGCPDPQNNAFSFFRPHAGLKRTQTQLSGPNSFTGNFGDNGFPQGQDIICLDETGNVRVGMVRQEAYLWQCKAYFPAAHARYVGTSNTPHLDAHCETIPCPCPGWDCGPRPGSAVPFLVGAQMTANHYVILGCPPTCA